MSKTDSTVGTHTDRPCFPADRVQKSQCKKHHKFTEYEQNVTSHYLKYFFSDYNFLFFL